MKFSLPKTELFENKHMILYTDGSCDYKTQKGGYGIVGYLDSKSTDNEFTIKKFHLNGTEEYTTNNRMELTAVLEGVKYFFKTYQINNFDIYSDSKLTINCAKKEWRRNKNIDLWEEYDELINNNNIKVNFIWVKAHNGNINNEEADELSRRYLR